MRTRKQRGQGMTEYVIIVGVVAVLSIAIILAFGNQIRNWFFVSGSQMAGDDSKKVQNKMTDAPGDEGSRRIDEL